MYKPTVRARLGRDARQVVESRQEALSSAAAVKRRLNTYNLAMTSNRPPTGHEVTAVKEISCINKEDDLYEDDQLIM